MVEMQATDNIPGLALAPHKPELDDLNCIGVPTAVSAMEDLAVIMPEALEAASMADVVAGNQMLVVAEVGTLVVYRPLHTTERHIPHLQPMVRIPEMDVPLSYWLDNT